MANVPKDSAEKFAKRLGDALFELECMQIAYEADRALQISRIEQYKDSQGKTFQKAQKAAVKGDEDAARIIVIEQRKKKLLQSLSKVWALYTGNEVAGEIIAEYVKRKGDYEKISKKYTKEQIEEAVSLWKKYQQMTRDLYAVRELEYRERMKEEKYKSSVYKNDVNRYRYGKKRKWG